MDLLFGPIYEFFWKKTPGPHQVILKILQRNTNSACNRIYLDMTPTTPQSRNVWDNLRRQSDDASHSKSHHAPRDFPRPTKRLETAPKTIHYVTSWANTAPATMIRYRRRWRLNDGVELSNHMGSPLLRKWCAACPLNSS